MAEIRGDQGRSGAATAAAQYDGLIVNNCALGALCSRKMYGKPFAVVEHFHSVRQPLRRRRSGRSGAR